MSVTRRFKYAFDANTFSAYGSTNNKIVEFATVVTNDGDGIVYNYNTSDGDKWTFLKDGWLWISNHMHSQLGGSTSSGISKNSSQLTTNIESISVSNRMSMSLTAVVAGAYQIASTAVSIQITSGDTIRVHTRGDVPANSSLCGVNFIFEEL